MAEHLEHHVTSQTRKDYLSFRGRTKFVCYQNIRECLIWKNTLRVWMSF